MKSRISWLLLPFGIGLCLMSFVLYSTDSSQAMSHHVPFIMLYGDKGQVETAVMPFLADNSLRYLREYPQPEQYLFEGNLPVPPGVGLGGLAIQMYQVTTPSIGIQGVISSVISATLPLPEVEHVYPHFEFMSYMPREIVIHGDCNDVNNLVMLFDPDLNQEDFMNLDYPGLPPTSNECIGLYSITNANKRVTDFTTVQTPGITEARVEPNYLTNGMMAGYGIFGSPAAMVGGAPPTSTSGTTPLATTGRNVGVFLFDTSPYQRRAEFFTETIKTTTVDIIHPSRVRLPINWMPFNPNRSVAAHGTFVATPIVELAPDSETHLMRVLNEDGLGNQYSFAVAVDEAIRYATGPTLDWDGVVFNYSLGLEDDATDQVKTAMKRMLDMVSRMDIVQVAATGNDSAYESVPQPMDLPASHADVIGVTAIVPGNQIACYANATDVGGVAARGGGAPRGVPICNVDQFVVDCATNGLIGCLHGWDPNSPTDHAYGIGTSFAAPFVSAFSAQVIEHIARGGARDDVRGTSNWVRPIQVQEFIETKLTPADPEMGDGYLGNWENVVPTGVGLETISAETVRLPLLALGLLLIAFSTATIVQQRRRSDVG